MSYDAVLSVDGNPINGTYRVTLGNALTSLVGLGIPVTAGTMNAVAVLVSVETQNARVCPGKSVGGAALGHVMASGASGVFRGTANVAALKLGNSAAGSNAVVEVTVYFYWPMI
jgi:hypothetical protein